MWFFFSLAFGSGGAGGSGGSGGGGGGSSTVVALFCCSNTGCHGCRLVDIAVMKMADVGDVVVCTKILYFSFQDDVLGHLFSLNIGVGV